MVGKSGWEASFCPADWLYTGPKVKVAAADWAPASQRSIEPSGSFQEGLEIPQILLVCISVCTNVFTYMLT